MTPLSNRSFLRSPPHRSLPFLLLLVLSLALAGCGGDGEKAADPTADAEAFRAQSKEIFTPAWSTNAAPPPKAGEYHELRGLVGDLPIPPTSSAPNPVAAEGLGRADTQWTIAIAVFRGESSFEDASQMLGRVRREGGLPQAYLQRRGPSTIIAYGGYEDPTVPAAQADLNRIQSLLVDGAPAYAFAYLTPPLRTGAVRELNEYDLLRAKRTYGNAAMYTLQVGWYGREDQDRSTEVDLKEFRAAAEAAVVRLRQEGELAYFYHGPNRSMVTVGVFDTSDFDPIGKPGFESARLRDTKRRHPLNLYNGAGYRYKATGMREAKLLESGLVLIPTR